ncbi:MAG: radical SAM protein [Desulfurococcaceae archaeon]
MPFRVPLEVYLLRPDAISVWSYEEVKGRLAWYRAVMEDRAPAKFLIARSIEANANPYDGALSLDELWDLHEELSRKFAREWEAARKGSLGFGDLGEARHSYLDVKVAIARRLMSPCRLCERRCGARRLEGRPGVCLMDSRCIVHSYFLHVGEEAPLVPSGTIFYGGCNFKCAFCQNYDISQVNARRGEVVEPVELARIQEELRKSGARNINHVGGEPTPHLPFILESMRYVRVNVPQLWNSNMYMSEEAMRLLIDVIDIWLPDLKYGNDECAWRLSKVRNYWEVATRNIKAAHDSGGDMIIRHLVLPNHVECCTRPVLKWISENAPRALVNVMDQYRPEHLVRRYPEKYQDIARRPRSEEILEAYRTAKELGLVFEPVS